MKIPLYQVDAFTSQVFAGNPAAVCLLEQWIDDDRLLSIAAENNLSETAFLVRGSRNLELRWFTPVTEVALCGHATLATAHVLFNCLGWSEAAICFETRKSGRLFVTRKNGLLEMDFPSRRPFPQRPPDGLLEALGLSGLGTSGRGGSALGASAGDVSARSVSASEVLGSEEDVMIVFENEKTIRNLHLDMQSLNELTCRGIIVTAPGEQCDFVSRFFAPSVGIPEDPVTGSAHCVLVPYWSEKLGKKKLYARQVSKRGGELFCEDRGERVGIAGNAVLYLEGTILI